MAKERILVVEDENDILDVIRYNLEKEKYQVITATTGEEAVEKAQEMHPDLILLDLMLPEMDGFDVCRVLKADRNLKSVPIMMVTAKGEETDVITGLELGAEDYITKPFSPRVLVARVRAVLRRQKKPLIDDSSTIQIRNIFLNPVRFEVKVDGENPDLTATEYHILHFLMRHPGWVFTRSQIIDSVKGTDYIVTDRSIDVQIVGLRKKLKFAGQYIETVRGIGYRFKE